MERSKIILMSKLNEHVIPTQRDLIHPLRIFSTDIDNSTHLESLLRQPLMGVLKAMIAGFPEQSCLKKPGC